MKPVYIIFGVSGSGKTTVGKLLATKLGIPFYDADDFHPQSNIDKMTNGTPLTDEDRLPWLDSLHNNILEWAKDKGAVLACSALKESYRERLKGDLKQLYWILLSGGINLISKRISTRKDHYMKNDLLLSQFEILEIPEYGIKVDISKQPEMIVSSILSEYMDAGTSEFGVIGLGVMGRSISLNILDHGFSLSAYNRPDEGENELIDNFRKMSSSFNSVHLFDDLTAFVQSLQIPRRILLMIKAGPATTSVIEQLSGLLDAGDVIIDGGNSYYKSTMELKESLGMHGIGFIGCGISGGEKGARFGPSIMPGGDPEDYRKVRPVLEAIAAKDSKKQACCTYIGENGSGHFVKMVHNGIEYAEMQLLAELFHLMKGKLNYDEIANIFESWNKSDLQSFLLEITIKILREKEENVPVLDLILDKAGNKGTGLWTSREALEMGTVNTMTSSAVFARYISAFKHDCETYNIDRSESSKPDFNIARLEKAYYFARVINHHQGFELMKAAASEYDWKLNFAEIARIWTNGCILKSSLIMTLSELYRNNDTILNAPGTIKQLQHAHNSLKAMLRTAIEFDVPAPAFSAAHNYWLSLTSAQLPANLIQAQRDFFGGHTFQRIDGREDEFFHYNWTDE